MWYEPILFIFLLKQKPSILVLTFFVFNRTKLSFETNFLDS
jgi:hypothetical protein